MPRKPFNTTCDIYKGPGTASPGSLVGTFTCRMVVEDGIFATGPGCPAVPAYLTIQGYQPQGAWTYPWFGMDSELADRVAIPTGYLPQYWILYTDIIIWAGQTPYFRGYLAYLPVPQPGEQGGLLFGGSAQVTTIPPFLAGGGLLFGGSAQVTTIPPLTGAGGILLGGSAHVTSIPPFLSYGGVLFGGDTSDLVSRMRIIIGEGGVLLGGDAVVVFTPGSTHYIEDTFTDTSGTPIASHTPEHGGPWTSAMGGPQVIGNSFQGNTYSSGQALATIDPGHTDYTLSVDFLVPIGQSYLTDYPLIELRYTDLSNTWYVYFFNGFLYLQCYVAGTPTVSFFTNAFLVPGTSYTVTCVVSSAFGINCSCNGAFLSSASGTWASVRLIGLNVFSAGGSNVGVRFDNLLVDP